MLQRVGESPSAPPSEEFELSETELNWLTQGLMVASFYHPMVEQRLIEMEAGRRPPRIFCELSVIPHSCLPFH